MLIVCFKNSSCFCCEINDAAKCSKLIESSEAIDVNHSLPNIFSLGLQVMYRIERKRAQKDIEEALQQSHTCMCMNTDKRVTLWCLSKLMIEN